MDTSSIALFSDDTACDVRDEFVDFLANGVSPTDATQSMLRAWSDAIGDADDGPVFWLALAATQWKYGCLIDQVQFRAIDIIDRGADLERWVGPSFGRRRALLLSLREKLLSPQPASRRPLRRKQVVVPSTKIMSPDSRALATAFELGRSATPNAPRSQVIVEMDASGSRGGGGVFVADCEFTEVSLMWINAEALQITYPSSAVVSDQKPTLFFNGRTIELTYRREAA